MAPGCDHTPRTLLQGVDIMAEEKETAKLTCPCCQATLMVDRKTLGILYATENRVRAGGASFEQSLQDLKEREKEKSGRFQQAVAEEKARKALLGKKFQELRKEAERHADRAPRAPLRPGLRRRYDDGCATRHHGCGSRPARMPAASAPWCWRAWEPRC